MWGNIICWIYLVIKWNLCIPEPCNLTFDVYWPIPAVVEIFHYLRNTSRISITKAKKYCILLQILESWIFFRASYDQLRSCVQLQRLDAILKKILKMSDLEIYFALFLELIKRRFISYKLLDLHQFVLWLLYHIKQKFLLKSGIVPRLYSICMMNAWKSLAICCHSNLWFISNRDWIIEEEKEQRDRERDLKKPCLIIIKIAEAQSVSPLCVAWLVISA